jgi:hypothetical protein
LSDTYETAVRTLLCLSLVISLAAGWDQSPAAETYRIEAPPQEGITTRYSAAQLSLLEKLNRAGRAELARLPRIAVPERWRDDDRDYSPLPRRYDAAAGLPKLLVVHLPGQAFGAYEAGELVRWGPISSGAASSPTPPGLYHLNWRATEHVSTVNPDWHLPWYFNFDNGEGRAFHEYKLPGLPVSHGCIRLLGGDARWLFEWGDEWRIDARGTTVLTPGTPVVIVGAYAFDAPPPWHDVRWLRYPVSLPASIAGR